MLWFVSEMHDLAVWSEVFDKHKGLAFKGGAVPSVAYRLKSGEDATDKALSIMRCYDEALGSNSAPSEKGE